MSRSAPLVFYFDQKTTEKRKRSIIIPLMFAAGGFTSDWDVLYMDDVRVKCMVIGIAFDLAGYLLMAIPYLFFWDFTDEKHKEVMRVLQERADAAAHAPENEESDLTVPVAQTGESE